MPTYRHGKNARFALGSYEISAWYKDISVPRSIAVSDVTPFNTSDKIYIVGQADAQITASGMWQSQTGTVAIASQTPTYSAPNTSITTATAHGLAVGEPVLLTGFSTLAYNGYWITQTGTTGSTLVIATNSNLGATGSAGTATGSSEEIDEVIQGVILQEGSPITVAPDNGFVIGNRCYLGFGKVTQHDVHAPVADVVALSNTFQMSSGVHGGTILADGSSQSATANLTVVDNTVATTIGWTANLHLIANSRSTSSTIKIQHSTDNSTWVDLVTFFSSGSSVVPANTITSEYQEAQSGTVNRYVRVSITLTAGTGSISPIISFSRS
jgi:hypothetical protein